MNLKAFWLKRETFLNQFLLFFKIYGNQFSEPKDNQMSGHKHFIHLRAKNGVDEGAVQTFLGYQILSVFVLTKSDRYIKNLGVLRNIRTLEFIGMVPIFYSGNSMFWLNPRLPAHSDLRDITVNSFRNT